jgi:hypothetical protein
MSIQSTRLLRAEAKTGTRKPNAHGCQCFFQRPAQLEAALCRHPRLLISHPVAIITFSLSIKDT